MLVKMVPAGSVKADTRRFAIPAQAWLADWRATPRAVHCVPHVGAINEGITATDAISGRFCFYGLRATGIVEPHGSQKRGVRGFGPGGADIEVGDSTGIGGQSVAKVHRRSVSGDSPPPPARNLTYRVFTGFQDDPSSVDGPMPTTCGSAIATGRGVARAYVEIRSLIELLDELVDGRRQRIALRKGRHRGPTRVTRQGAERNGTLDGVGSTLATDLT